MERTLSKVVFAGALLSSACHKDKQDEDSGDATKYIACQPQETGFIEEARGALNGQYEDLTEAVYEVTDHVSIRAEDVLDVAGSTNFSCASALDLDIREVETGVEADLILGNNAVDVLAGNYHNWLEDYNAGKWLEGSNTEIRAQYLDVGEEVFNNQIDGYFSAKKALGEEWMHASAHHALNVTGHTELDPTLCGRTDLVDPEDCPASDEVHAWTLAASSTLDIIETERRNEIEEAIALIGE